MPKPKAATKKTAVPATPSRPTFHTVDPSGLPVEREARTIGELPPGQVSDALLQATAAIGQRLNLTPIKTIHASTPVFMAFDGMHRARAKNHAQAALLLSTGADIGLDLLPAYN